MSASIDVQVVAAAGDDDAVGRVRRTRDAAGPIERCPAPAVRPPSGDRQAGPAGACRPAAWPGTWPGARAAGDRRPLARACCGAGAEEQLLEHVAIVAASAFFSVKMLISARGRRRHVQLADQRQTAPSSCSGPTDQAVERASGVMWMSSSEAGLDRAARLAVLVMKRSEMVLVVTAEAARRPSPPPGLALPGRTGPAPNCPPPELARLSRAALGQPPAGEPCPGTAAWPPSEGTHALGDGLDQQGGQLVAPGRTAAGRSQRRSSRLATASVEPLDQLADLGQVGRGRLDEDRVGAVVVGDADLVLRASPGRCSAGRRSWSAAWRRAGPTPS